MATDFSQMTLAEMAQALAPDVADAAVFDGWNDRAVAAAAERHGLDPAVARLAFPDGAMGMIAAWIATIDRVMIDGVPADLLATMGFSARIRALLVFRIEYLAQHRETLRRALTTMAMPTNALASARLAWRSADLMWRLAGDTATDFNHYSKRALLASIYGATLAVLIDDESAGQADTYAFLDRRLADIARFGKATARLTGGDRERFSLVRMLGRLRYPAM